MDAADEVAVHDLHVIQVEQQAAPPRKRNHRLDPEVDALVDPRPQHLDAAGLVFGVVHALHEQMGRRNGAGQAIVPQGGPARDRPKKEVQYRDPRRSPSPPLYLPITVSSIPMYNPT